MTSGPADWLNPFADPQPCVFNGPLRESQRATADPRYSYVRMPTKPTLFLQPNPLPEPEPLSTRHSRVFFCIGVDRFAIDFTSTVTELNPQPTEVILIHKKRVAHMKALKSELRKKPTPKVLNKGEGCMANAALLQNLTYEVVKEGNYPTEWRAEAIDDAGERECYVVIVAGPRAEERAA